jgi:protein-L-isoaspartate(D-aspartate) O-methyltransferase
MKDTFKHKGMRKQLINELRNKGIENLEILKAFDDVPRHFFFRPRI